MRTRHDTSDAGVASRADSPWSRLRSPRVRFLFGLAWLSLACTGSGDEPPASPLAVRDSAGVRIVTVGVVPDNVPRWELLEPPELAIGGQGEGGAPHFVFGLSASWLLDGRILAADPGAGRLHLFDPTGRYLRSLGGKGEGPGELRSLSTVSVVPGDSFYVYDSNLDRLSLFHPDGGFVRALRLSEEGGLYRLGQVQALPSRRLMDHRYHADFTADRSLDPEGRLTASEHFVTLYDPRGRLVVGPIPFATSYSGLSERGDFIMPFRNRPFVTVCAGQVVLGGGQDWGLSFLDEEGRTVRVIRWTARREPITAGEIEAIREELEGTGLGQRPKLLETALAEELLPEHRPALQQVLCDSEGHLWAGRFETRVSLSTWWPTRWDVLAPDGTPIARLRLPPDARLVAVDGDRVMVVARDAVDVEEVRVHRVGPTGDGEASSR